LPACSAPFLEAGLRGCCLPVELLADASDQVEDAEAADQQRKVDRPGSLRVDGAEHDQGQHREHQVRGEDRQRLLAEQL